MVKAARPKQWAKNILIFVPLLTSMRIFQIPMVALAPCAFISFSCCSSAIYIINDLSDLAADRAHRTNGSAHLRLAGYRSPGALMSAGLITLALAVAWFALPRSVLVMLLIYTATTLAYSIVIKSRLMVDVLVLAVLYCMRVITGNLSTGIPISEWLLAFALFFFLSGTGQKVC